MDTATKIVRALDVAEGDGLVFACRLNGDGAGTLTDWAGVTQWQADQGPIWIHLDRTSPRAQQWLRTDSGLSESTCAAILAEETRPRVFHAKLGFVAILRGVNMNPGADLEDLVSLRLWSDGIRVISVRRLRMLTPRDILAQLIDDEVGPETAAELFERLVSRLIERMASAIDSIDDRIDAIEDRDESPAPGVARREVAGLRSEIMVLRRYMAPQREALGTLSLDPPKWLDESARARLRETHDRLQRYVEDLDLNRERVAAIKDDISNQLSEALNKNMYLLSIIAALFLPLGFATGLLGINVGGIPGTDYDGAFYLVCAIMVAIAIFEFLLFRRLKWL